MRELYYATSVLYEELLIDILDINLSSCGWNDYATNAIKCIYYAFEIMSRPSENLNKLGHLHKKYFPGL